MVLDVMRALGRRWYVVLAGLLLTAGLVFGAYKASPPEYNARALVLVIPSKAGLGKGGNPLLQLTGLEQPASIVSAYFASAPALAEVAQLSPTAEFEVALDASTRGPVIAVDVTDKTAADTLKVLDYLLTRIPTELQRLQQEADARNGTFVGTMLLVADREAKLDIHGTLRITIAALVVGLVGTGISAFAIDGLMQRRRLSEPPPGVAGSEGKTDDAVPEDVTEEVAATDRPGYALVDAALPRRHQLRPARGCDRGGLGNGPPWLRGRRRCRARGSDRGGLGNGPAWLQRRDRRCRARGCDRGGLGNGPPWLRARRRGLARGRNQRPLRHVAGGAVGHGGCQGV